MSPSSRLCPTAKILASTLDSSFAAALLLSGHNDAHVLHKNFHASTLLQADHELVDKGDNDPLIHLSHWIQTPTSSTGDKKAATSTSTWEEEFSKLQSNGNSGRETLQCFLVKDERTSVTVNLSLLDPCLCCQRAYVVAYVKTEMSRLSVDEVSALQLDKDLVDASFDPMFAIDEEGLILMVNEAAVKQFGYSHSELLHQNISMICGGQHAAHHQNYMNRYLATGQSKIVNNVRKVPARRKDGTEFFVELGMKEVSSNDGIHKHLFVGYMRDLSPYDKHENDLKHKECILQNMINASFDPMFQVNEQGIICLVNNAACSLFGYTRAEFLGQNVSIICGGPDAAPGRHDQYLRNYLTTGERKIIGRKRKVMARRKDGTDFEVELGVQEVILEGKNGERMFCGYVRDITQQRLVQRALRKKDAEMKGQFFGRNES